MSRNKRAGVRLPASITLFAFLLTQLLGPLPAFAQDTLRTEPIAETAGLEELEAKFRQPPPVAHPTQTVLSGLEEPDAGKVEEHFVNRQRASIQRLWFEKRVLPANHPATRYVKKQLKRTVRTVEPEIFVIEDEEENAFAAGTNQIYVTTGMLRMLETEEELLALLMHELTHIERKDPFSHRNLNPFDLYALGTRRLAEFYADTAMLLELDKRGANPIGAIHFTQKMAALIEEKRHDPKYEKVLASLEDWDPVHGSAAQRHINMRELVRFVDLRHLSEETHAIAPNQLKLGQAEPKKMTKKRTEKLPDLKPENFWRSFGRLVQDYPQAVWSEVAREFIHSQGVKLTADEERAFFFIIHFHLLKGQEPFALNESGQTKWVSREEVYRYFAPRTVIGLFERNVFEKIGLWLTPHELISIGEESFKNALKDKPVDHFETEASVLTELRRQAVDYHQRWYGHSINFVPEWDANLVSAFLVEHAVQGEARYSFEDVQTIELGQRTTDKRVIFENEIPLQVIPQKVLQQFLTLNGIGLVTLDTVLEKVEDALKVTSLFSRVILEQEDGRKVERYVVYKPDDPQVLRFQRTLQDILTPIVGSAMPFVQNKGLNVLQALDNAILLSGTLGRVFSGGTEKPEGYEDKEHYPFTQEFIREVPMQRILTLFGSVAQRADRMSSAHFTREIRAWYSDLANESDRDLRFYDILNLLSDHLENKHDLGQDELDENDYLTNEEMEKQILLKLYTSKGFEKRFLQEADGIIGTRNSKILSEPGQFISWLRRQIEEANESGFASQWTFDVRDKSQLHNLMVEIKYEILERMSRSTPETIFKLALELASEWGIAFVNIPRAAYEKHWAAISERLNEHLRQNPDFPSTAQDFERILALSLLSQESFSAMSLSAVSFRELIRRSKNFDEAFSYLKKYSFLPRTILREGIFTLVEEKANSHEELQALSEWFMTEIDRMLETGGDVMTAEIAQATLRFIRSGERLEFFKHLISTNETDEEFKNYMARQWWRVFNSSILDVRNYRDIALLAYYGEEQGDADKINLARQQTSEYLSQIDFAGIHMLFFDEFYPALFRLDSVVIYLLLRSLTLEGGEAIFRSSAAKTELIRHFIDHYLKLGKGETADRVVREVTETLANDLEPEDLFYFLGPALSQVALQVPAESYPTERIVELLLKESLESLKKDFPDIEDEQKHPVAWELLRTRLRAFVKGITPSIERRAQSGTDLRVFFPENVPYIYFEDTASERLANLMPQRKMFEKQVAPMELAVEVSKHVGSLAVRLLQLVGMYFELSPEDRQTLSEVYDAVRGQTKLQAYLVMKREAADNPRFKVLFDTIVEFGEMAGGGSIVTVYRAVDGNQDTWALGVKNPNAAYRSGEFLRFAQQILDGLIRRGKDENAPELKYYQLLKLVLNDAHQWVLNEISDPSYVAKNERFAQQNDHRSSSPDRFKTPAGLRHKIFIPDIQETDTDVVRWEKFVRGASFNDFLTEFGKSKEKDSKTRQIAKDSVAVITQNYFFQLLETGVVHPDIHPGQFLMMPGEMLAVLDRKNLLNFENDGKDLLLEVVANLLLGNQDKVFDKITAHFISDERRTDSAFMARLRELVTTSFNPASPEQSVSSVLWNLKQQGVDIPLKWILVTKNLMALNKMAQLAGFSNILGALMYSPAAEASPDIAQVAARITNLFPRSSQKLISLVGQEYLRGNLGAFLERLRSNSALGAGLEETTEKRIATLTAAVPEKQVLVINTGVGEEKGWLEQLIRQAPQEFKDKLILFGAHFETRQLADYYKIPIVTSGNPQDLAFELITRPVDGNLQVKYLGDSVTAGQLKLILPSSIRVSPIDPAAGLRELFLALGVSADLLDSIRIEELQGELSRQRAA